MVSSSYTNWFLGPAQARSDWKLQKWPTCRHLLLGSQETCPRSFNTKRIQDRSRQTPFISNSDSFTGNSVRSCRPRLWQTFCSATNLSRMLFIEIMQHTAGIHNSQVILMDRLPIDRIAVNRTSRWLPFHSVPGIAHTDLVSASCCQICHESSDPDPATLTDSLLADANVLLIFLRSVDRFPCACGSSSGLPGRGSASLDRLPPSANWILHRCRFQP